MILEQNPNYLLANSQLLPLSVSVDLKDTDHELLKNAQQAYQLLQQNKKSEALSLYSQVIDNYPNIPFFYACRSILNHQLDDEEGSFYDYQVAKSLDFNYHHFFEWKENEGEMLETDELAELQELVRKNKDDQQQHINLAMLLVQHYKYTEAIAAFSNALALRFDPAYLVSRAAIYTRMLQYDKAYADLSAAIQADKTLANAYFYRGRLLFALHDFEGALTDLQSGIDFDVNNTVMYEERALIYDRMGKYDKALQDYSTVIEKSEPDFYPYVLRAEIFEKLQDYTAALQDYDQAILLNPYYSDLYQYRGELKEKLGDPIGSAADFKRFEELELD